MNRQKSRVQASRIFALAVVAVVAVALVLSGRPTLLRRGFEVWLDNAEAVLAMFAVAGALAGGLWTIFVYWRERRRERELDRIQRENERIARDDDLRWRMARAAKELNDEMLMDPEPMAAMNMVDDDFESLVIGDAPLLKTDISLAVKALAFEPLDGSETSRAIRKCMDAWMFYLAEMQHFVNSKLVTLYDVHYPTSYYVKRLRAVPEVNDALIKYIQHYEMNDKSIRFMNDATGVGAGTVTAK